MHIVLRNISLKHHHSSLTGPCPWALVWLRWGRGAGCNYPSGIHLVARMKDNTRSQRYQTNCQRGISRLRKAPPTSVVRSKKCRRVCTLHDKMQENGRRALVERTRYTHLTFQLQFIQHETMSSATPTCQWCLRRKHYPNILETFATTSIPTGQQDLRTLA